MIENITENIKDFNADHIFDCGQCFRWSREEDGSYTGIAFGKVVNMKFEAYGEPEKPGAGRLIIKGADEEDFEKIWRPYLDLDRDYGKIKCALASEDEILAKAVTYGQGIRILKQDLWETMVSFIISQNNNIPRIKGCIEALARWFGEPVNFGDYSTFGKSGKPAGKEYFNLPTAEVLASLDENDLADCRLGYRAKYLIETARQVLEKGGIEKVEELLGVAKTGEDSTSGTKINSDEVISELQTFSGVGPKVASCIALFGLGRHDAFPIDVWVRRVMNRLYGIDENNVREMKEYAKEHFGEWGGFAQQYLFYYIRSLG